MSRDRIVIYPFLRDRMLDYASDLIEIARDIEGLSLARGGNAEYNRMAAKRLAQALRNKAGVLSLVFAASRGRPRRAGSAES